MEKKEEKKNSFGRFLSSVRSEKGLDLDYISKKIRVNYGILQHIENEDHAKLPDDVFVKGFIRAYADTLGIDGNEIIKLYLESYNQYQNALKAEADLVGYTSRFWTRFFVAGIVLFLVICFSIYFMPVKNGFRPDSVEKESAPEKIIEKEIKKGNIPANMNNEIINIQGNGGNPNSQAETFQKQIYEKLYLKIRAIDQTWIKIIVDKQKPREFTLKAGDLKEIKGEKNFNLLIGNASGVKIYLNDKPVEIVGKSGQVVTLMLP